MQKKLLAILPVALLVALVVSYLPALRAGFIWNDPAYVTENTTLDGLAGLTRIWTDTSANEQYYPLVFTTYWIEKRLWGLHPFGYHLVNVLLHGAAALLLWRFLRRLALPAAGLAATAFALHPVCVESVAWVTERKNTLSLVLVLLSAHAWLACRAALEARETRQASKKKRARPDPLPLLERPAVLYAAALALFTLALLAKTTASVLPAVLLVLVWWQKGRLRWPDVRSLAPFFAVGVGFALHTAWLERTMVRATGNEWAHGFLERLVLAGQTTTFYAAKILWPANLSFIYPRWKLDAGSPEQWLPVIGWAAALACAAFLAFRGRRGPLAGLLIFGGVLFPAMGFFNVYAMRYSWVADHFAYQAVAAGMVGVLCGAATILEPLPAPLRRSAGALAWGGLAVFAAITFQQGRAYRDEGTLWRHTLERNADCFICLTNYGNLLLKAGKTDEALTLLTRSITLKPDAVPTLLNLARIAEERGRFEEAASRLRAALDVESGDEEVRLHLATIYTKSGRLEDAIREYREVLRIPSREDFLAHNGIGVALVRSGRLAEGVEHLQTCVLLRPDYAPCRANLEAVLAAAGSR